MSFAATVRQKRQTLAKGGGVDVYLAGIPTFRIGALMHGQRLLDALEADALIELGKAQKWMESAYHSESD